MPINLLSIIIPVYNEEKIIETTLKQVINFFDQKEIEYELIVVDNDSTDGTKEILQKFASRLEIITASEHGKGYAVKQGVFAASGDLIIFFDADLSAPLSEFDNLVQYTARYDIVIGSRALIRRLVQKHQACWKESLGRLGNLLIRLVLNLPYKDTQCGFKLFNKKAAALFYHLTISGWGFDFEWLYLAKKAQLKVVEVPIKWSNRAESKVKKIDYWKTFWEVIRVRLNQCRGNNKKV